MPRTTPPAPDWRDVGDAAELARRPLQQLALGRVKIALSCIDGAFAAISGVCNHVGGPLGDGRLAGEYVVCPWHNWKFHRATGKGEPGYEEDAVPAHDVRVENGRLLVNLAPSTARTRKPHPPHPLTKLTVRGQAGGPAVDAPVRVLAISTTNMDEANPRPSTSDHLLTIAADHAREALGAESRIIRLSELSFRHCEGYYSKSAHACTWPCSITQMDPADQMDRVYDGVVQWADVILVATPIRWGGASSLYYKMIERMNCIQNQITIANRVLMRNKVAGFIVTGGQDNVQAVVGQMLTFFGELGAVFPQFPFIAHSRGWSAEDMENNVAYVRDSAELREGAQALAQRAVETARALIAAGGRPEKTPRGGRKAHELEVRAQI